MMTCKKKRLKPKRPPLAPEKSPRVYLNRRQQIGRHYGAGGDLFADCSSLR